MGAEKDNIMRLRESINSFETTAQDTERQLKATQDERSRVTNERDRAIQEAAKPFDRELLQIDTTIRGLTSLPAENVFSHNIDVVVARALRLEAVQRFKESSDPIKSLADHYAEYVAEKDEDYHSHESNLAHQAITRLCNFEDFYSALQQAKSLPVAIAATDWSEKCDTQAEAEGRRRDMSTGDYIRTGSLFLGKLALDDLVIRQDFTGHVEGIDLRLNGMSHTKVGLDWMHWEERQTTTAEDDTVTLFGDLTSNSIGRTNDWDIVHNQPLPEPYQQTVYGGSQRLVRPSVQQVIWGKAAKHITL